MNWGTMVQAILEKAPGKLDFAGEAPRVKRAICESINMHKRERLFFQQGRWSLKVLEGQETYAHASSATDPGVANLLPWNLHSISGQTLDFRVGGDPDNSFTLNWVAIESADQFRRNFGATESQPMVWGYYAQKLEIWPPPEAPPGAPDEIHGRGIFDPGSPRASYEGAAWKFYQPGQGIGGTEMDDAYPDPAEQEVNDWFVLGRGFEVIVDHSLFLLWSGPWQATAGQDQAALTRYAEKLASLQEQSGARNAPRQAAAYVGQDW